MPAPDTETAPKAETDRKRINMNGKYLLLGVSILLIIFGGFAALQMLTLMDSILSSGNAWAILTALYVLVMCFAELALGIAGVIRCGDPSKAGFFIVSGVVIFLLSGVNIARLILAGTFQISLLIGLILPVLFIVGGIIKKNTMQMPDAAGSKRPALRRVLYVAAIAVIAVLAATIVGLPFVDQSLTILSLKKLDDYPLYSINYYGDYNLNYEADNPKIDRHCTTFLAFNGKGEPIYARNFDDAFQSHPMAMVTTHAPGKYATIAMCDLFFMGYKPGHLPAGSLMKDQALLYSPRVPTDGMNDYGVAISFQGVPYHDDTSADPGKKSVDQTAMMRLVLDNARNVEEAVDLIKSCNVVLEGAHVPGPDEPKDNDGLDSTHFLLADASGNCVIVEFIGGEVVIVKKSDPWQVVTNFIVSGRVHDGVGQDRDSIAEDELRVKNGVLSEDEAMALLQKVSQPGTHWSAVYNLKTGEVWLAMARNYSKIIKFKLQMHN